MCRIFAVRAATPVSVRPAFDGLRKLAAEHKDGWGVAHFSESESGSQKRIETSIISAESCSRFDALGDLTTQAMLVHIRLASVGTVHERNNHPFTAGPWVFMHNGTLKNFDRARARFEAELDPAFRAELKGETDSERCFALFRTYLKDRTDSEDVAAALTRVFRTAERLCDDELPGKRSAMNFLVSDGVRVFATRRDRTLFTLSRPDLAAIASAELLPDERWSVVPDDTLVIIDEKLQVTSRPIP
jgi:predicted glutamine amidotransferase